MFSARVWFLNTHEGQAGPYTADELRAWVAAGQINADWYVWREGLAGWQPLSDTPDISASSVPPSPPISTVSVAKSEPQKKKEPAKRSVSKGFLVTGAVILLLAGTVGAGVYLAPDLLDQILSSEKSSTSDFEKPADKPDIVVKAPLDGTRVYEYESSTLVLDTGAILTIPGTMDPDRTRISLLRGRVTAKVRNIRSGQEFVIQTINATVGVRGTVFSVEIKEGATVVDVTVGQVEVKALKIEGEPMILTPGQSAIIDGMSLPKRTDTASLVEQTDSAHDTRANAAEELPRSDPSVRPLSEPLRDSRAKVEPPRATPPVPPPISSRVAPAPGLLSLDYWGDIRALLGNIEKITHTRIVVDANVQAVVKVHVENVPFEAVLDALTTPYGLQWHFDGAVYRVEKRP